MQIKQENGILSATTNLPLFEEKLKSLVDPKKIAGLDEFLDNPGPLYGRVTSGKTWVAVGTTGRSFTVGNGFIYNPQAGQSRVLLPHENTGKVYAAVEWNAGYVGLLIRANSAPNYFQISIATASNGLRVDKVGGSAMEAKIVNFPLISGKIYHLGVEYSTSQIKIFVDNEIKLTINDSELSENLNIGVVTSDPLNKIHSFIYR